MENNYHVIAPDQRWAYDLLVIKTDATHAGDSTRVESNFCYGMLVMAPAAGWAERVHAGFGDQKAGYPSETANEGGNELLIRIAPGQYLALCHLKPGSIRVAEGDSVQQGQVLAQVGNSGHTSEPHLHIHLQDDTTDMGEGIPLYFDHYRMNGAIVESGMPLGGLTDTGFSGQIVQHIPRIRQ